MPTLKQKSHTGIAFVGLLIIFGVVIGLLFVEIGVRLYDRHYRGLPVWSAVPPSALRFDPVLGWVPQESYRKVSTAYTQRNVRYLARFSTDSLGRRVCGDSTTGQAGKILVVGDSFTQDWGVSDNQEYYCVAARSLNVSVHAFAAGGYGTLQERMALERLLSREQPDLVIVQICYNDFINNDFDLEKASWQNNHFAKRPYWRAGRVEFLLPNHFPIWFEVLRLHSRIASNLYDGFVNRSAFTRHSVEEDIEREGGGYPGFQTAAVETSEIFGQISQLLKRRNLVAFATDQKEPYRSGFRQTLQKFNIPLIEDGAVAVQRASAEGMDVFMHDGVHWNETGNRIAGEALTHAISKYFRQ